MAAAFSNITTTGANCGAVSTQCATSTSANGQGGTAGSTGASGSVVIQYTVGGVAANSSFSTEPSTSAASGTAFPTQPAVTINDYTGAGVNNDPVQLAIASQPMGPTATLNCATNPVSSSSAGMVTFAGCSISGPVGNYTFSATDTADGIVVATSSTLTLTPGPATQLAFVQQPTDSQSDTALTPTVTVAVEDAASNVETGDSSTAVSLAIGSNPGGGTLTGGGLVTVSSGVATFTGLSINKSGAGYTLTASSTPSYTAATSSTFNIAPGAANDLVFVQGPTNTAAGTAMTPALTVAIEDANGNVETGDNSTTVSLAIGANPGGGTLTGGGAVTVSAGVATFSGLSIDKAGTGYTLTASSTPSYTGATSSAFNIVPGAPTQLAFVHGPTDTTAGSNFSPALTIAVQDANGNVETGDNSTTVSLAIGTNPGGGTLTGGGAVTVAAGVATFSGLSIDKAGTGYTLAASSSPSNTGATSSAFNITPGTPTQLAFVQGPTNTAAGTAMTPGVTVAVEDANGNVETGDNTTTVGIAIGANPSSGTLSGGSAVTVVSGIATFSGLSINTAGAGYTLIASSSPSYTPATSAAVTISPGTANQLTFVQGPTIAQAGSAIAPAVTVAVEDDNGNIETGDNSTQISLSIGINAGGGTLTGGGLVTVSSGVATFTGLSINKSGAGYTLTASSTPSYTAATSSTFNIAPGAANDLVFVQGPTNTAAGTAMTPALTVAIEDANGNVETGDNSTTVSLAIGANPGGGTLTGGGAVTVSAGVATFSGLSIDKAGTGYTLTASSTPSYTGATSSAFNIVPGAPTQLAFVHGPTDTTAGSNFSPALTIAVQDANGNVETGDNSTTVSLAIGTNPGGGTLTGGGAVTVAAGVATFSGLSIDKAGTGYTLAASSSPSNTGATSSAFKITPGTPTQLAFVQGPTNTAAGTAMTPAVTVAVEDANGNVETGDNTTTVGIAIGANPSSGTLSGGSAVTVSAGVATFAGLSINQVGTGYTLAASSTPSYAAASSAAFNMEPGAADHLAFIQGPSNATGGSSITPDVTVAVVDAYGNVETGDNASQVSLSIGTNPNGGTLTGGSAVTVSAGVATFTGLSINLTGEGYTLTASSSPSLTGATSGSFDISAGAANMLVFVKQPTSTQSDSTIGPALTIAVEDANGNVETGDNSTTVSLAIGTNPGGGTLTGGGAVTVSAGVATFSGLSIDKAGTGYTLAASSSPSNTGAISSAFNITPGPATQLAFVQQPSDVGADTAMDPAVTVVIEDAQGNVETGDSATQVSLAFGTNAGGGTLTGGSAVTVSAGIATFSRLSIDKVGAGYTLAASSTPSYSPATSSAFEVNPGTPTQLVFVQGPTNADAGSTITPAVTVEVEDANGNVVTGDNATTVTLGIGTNPGGGTLSGGGATTVSAGVATFSGLSISSTGAGYTLTASSTPSYTAATSSTFNIAPGAANDLVFVQGPTNTAAGTAMTPALTVAIEDANGNVETGDNSTTVSLAIGANPGGGTLTGGGAVTVSAGVATFSGLSIDKAGTGYTLTASSTPSYTGATSSAFNIVPGAPTQLAFVHGPTDTTAGSNFSPALTIAVQDANGNVETGDNSTTVSLAIGTNPGGGTLTGGGAVTVAAGVATFSGLSIDKAGTGYTLAASSSPSNTGATSSAFNITPGTPTQLAFVQGPTNTAAGTAMTPAVTVAVEDANGNVETGDNTTTVGIAFGTNAGDGTLTGGGPIAVSSGVATFSALSIDKIGTGYTLIAASSPSYTAATSSAFAVSPGTPAQLVFGQDPGATDVGATIAPAVSVAVEDAFGNVESGDNATQVTLTLGANPGGGTLSGGSAITVSSGVATFSALWINEVGNGYTLVASSSPSDPDVTSSTFDITPGPATQLAFVQDPTDSQASAAITPVLTVAVEDAEGNIESGDDTTQVSLAIGTNPGSGTLTGGAAQTVSAGVATFNGLSIDKVGTGYTLVASSAPSNTDATSSAFDITPGPAAQLAFFQGPSNTVAGSDMTPPVTVAVEDAEGNVETGDSATQVSLAIGTNPGGGTLGGGSALTVSAGVVTFPNLSISAVGTGYTFVASSSPSYTSATSSSFSVTGGQLALSCAPLPGQPASTCQNIDLPPATLDGAEQTVQAPGATLYVSDNRGLSQYGWSMSAYLVPTPGNVNAACNSVATFCNADVGAAASNPQGQIPASNFSVGNVTCTAVSGNSNPSPQPGPGGAFPAGGGAVALCSAPPGQSAGTFKVGSTYSLTIPEGIYAGHYMATVEYLAF